MSDPEVSEELDDTTPGAEPEPSLQGLLEMAIRGSSGWNDLEPSTLGKLLKKQLHDQQTAMRKSSLKFRACFMETEAGREVMQILLNQTLRTTTWPVSAMTDPQMLMAYGIWRESQNAFMAAIIEAIAAADNIDMKPRSEMQ